MRRWAALVAICHRRYVARGAVESAGSPYRRNAAAVVADGIRECSDFEPHAIPAARRSSKGERRPAYVHPIGVSAGDTTPPEAG
jgi:hypothetical protein